MTGSYFEDVPVDDVQETPGLTVTSAHVAIYLGLTRELDVDGATVPDLLPPCFTTGLGWRVPKPPLVVLAFMGLDWRSEEHTSELQSPFLNSYAVFFLKK